MPPFVKYVIIAFLLLIVASLGTALYRLATNKDKEANDTATVKALTVRVGLSIALFIMLIVLSALGIITPNG